MARENQPDIVEGEIISAGDKGGPTDPRPPFSNKIKKGDRPINRVDAQGERVFTAAEARLFKVMTDPTYFGYTNRRKCEVAKINITHFYKIVRNAWFADQVKQNLKAALIGHAAPILHAAVKTAKMEGRQGHADRKMLLQMMDLHSDNKTVQHTGPNGGPIEVETTVNHVFDREKFERLYTARTRGALPSVGSAKPDGAEKPVD